LQLSFRMAPRQAGRIAAQALAALFLIATSCLGGYNAINEWDEPVTLLQRSVSVASVIYSLLGFVGAFALILRRPWTVAVVVVWGTVLTYTGATAVIAYDTGASLTTVLAAIALCLIMASLIVWLAKVGSRIPEAS
jgi:hypothetical protein